jgi:non-specific serine/threonine protein kinase
MIAHYRLIEPLGRGGMGEVWLAEDTQLPRRVAVKLLPVQVSGDAEAVERLVREARATASIDHPAVASVYEAGVQDGRPYLVMQQFDGETLASRLERGPLDVDEVVALATAVADALAEVHALGIVHRDLKPSNIMLTARGPRILDFGVARAKDATDVTATGGLVGTPVAMSPEQIEGRSLDNRTDLWALGVVLYQGLTGKLPFAGRTYAAVFQQVLHLEPEPPSAHRPGIAPELDFIVMKLLRKAPEHRYPRAEDLLADLASCRSGRAGAPSPILRVVAVATPRLAVLPFEVLSPSDEDALLARGLAEDLIVDLTRVAGLSIASRAEVAGYDGRDLPPRTLARELGVDYLVTGSVRRLGNRARISAQLVRAADGHILWAERFDRTLEDLFAVQEEVSRRIVDALQVTLRPGEREILGRVPTRNTEAYALYLRARELLGKSRAENLRAERLLEQALDLDPSFALAHAALGECYAVGGLRWWADLAVADRALDCARRALELEPGLPDAYYVEMMVRRLQGRPEEVLRAIEQVLATNPDDGQAREWAAWSYMALGQPERALPVLERMTHRYTALSWLSNCHQMLGRPADAQRYLVQLRERLVEEVRRDPEAVHQRSLLGVTLVRLGEGDSGIAQAERAVALAPDDGRLHYNAACAYALAGRSEDAIEQLRQGVANLPSYAADWPRRDPDLASLHGHPEFRRLFGAGEGG